MTGMSGIAGRVGAAAGATTSALGGGAATAKSSAPAGAKQGAATGQQSAAGQPPAGGQGAAKGQQSTAQGQQPQSAAKAPQQQATRSTEFKGTQQQQQSGTTGKSAQKPFLSAKGPKNFKPPQGKTMWGQVTGRKGNTFTMKFGKATLTTRSKLPFSVGQRVQVAFTGGKNGQIGMHLLKSMNFSKMSRADLTQTLAKMNLPVNEKTMTIAKGLVEFKLPLTPKNMADFSKVMSSLPRPMTTTDLAAASFLRMANVPLTPQNVMTMANFLARNPMLGAQLFEMKKGIKGVGDGKDADDRNLEVLEEISGKLDNYVVDPRKMQQQQLSKNMKNLAKEQGIERIEHGFGGSNMEEGWELMRLMKEAEGLPGLQSQNFGEVLAAMQSVSENLQAHNLMNAAKARPELAFYFLQLPMVLDDEPLTAEVRIGYEEEEGKKVVDPENTEIEFYVNTENLGELHFKLRVRQGIVNMDVGAGDEEIEEFVETRLPLLAESLEKTGYSAGRIRTKLLDGTETQPIIEREELESLERVNVNA